MGKEKTRKMRGSKSCGYGGKKKHRGKGSRGGVGFGGSKKQKMLKIQREFPDHFDHRKLKKKVFLRTINIKNLERFDGSEINLTELGYDKLLGEGEVKKKLKITVSSWSKPAEDKIKAAGGEIVAE